jgi:hypothetical protein
VEYKPPKTELEQWKECALKSNYLLQQIIMLGGGKNENPKLTSDLEKREEVSKNKMANFQKMKSIFITHQPRGPKWHAIVNDAWLQNVNLINDLAESRKDLMRKNENLEPILDMIEDINIPVHTEYDKEFAGVPSSLTNIT